MMVILKNVAASYVVRDNYTCSDVLVCNIYKYHTILAPVELLHVSCSNDSVHII